MFYASFMPISRHLGGSGMDPTHMFYAFTVLYFPLHKFARFLELGYWQFFRMKEFLCKGTNFPWSSKTYTSVSPAWCRLPQVDSTRITMSAYKIVIFEFWAGLIFYYCWVWLIVSFSISFFFANNAKFRLLFAIFVLTLLWIKFA